MDHPSPPLSHPETFSMPHTLASWPAQLPFSPPLLREYKANNDLETSFGILIRTMGLKAKDHIESGRQLTERGYECVQLNGSQAQKRLFTQTNF